MKELHERISEALQREEARAERFASRVRLILLAVLGVVALLNAPSLTGEANAMNYAVLGAGIMYGLIVSLHLARRGYHSSMKYITSCADISLLFLLLFLYTRIEIPSVALKNYAFLVVFPLIALSAFRYDRTLTIVVGGLAVLLYLLLLGYLARTQGVAITGGGYERELFSGDVTFVGQLTKILILSGYVLLMTYLAGYSRRLIGTLVAEEVNARHQKEQADLEIAVASEVQRQFLPSMTLPIAGLDIVGTVVQGKLVGGDYFDALPLGRNRVFLISADVVGNGMAAALVMAEVRAATHLLAAMEMDLAQFMTRLNALILESTDKKSFVTAFAAEINPHARSLRYVVAGHPLPILRAGGGARFLEKGTIPLGWRRELPHLAVMEAGFPPGAVLAAFTDGLTEQTNASGEQFGEERVRRCVEQAAGANAESLVRTLLDDTRTFSGGELDDDVSVVVVRFPEARA